MIAKVTLLAKYTNFADIFSKQNANILLEYSMYNLAIEIEKKTIAF